MKLKNKYVFAISFSLFLMIITTYILLDTFVIAKRYIVIKGNKSAVKNNINAIIDENSYIDENITIKLNFVREYDTSIYVADVKINNPKYLKTAFADNTFGENIIEKTSDIAKKNNAILAVNGDYYGIREKGYVLRNGIVYRDSIINNKVDLVIYRNGGFDIIKEDDVSVLNLLKSGAYNILSFGPALVYNGEIVVGEDEDITTSKVRNPRTALGFIDDLHYVFVVCGGRNEENQGLYLYELAEFMKRLDVKVAYNLDGGGSTTMFFNGAVVNKSNSIDPDDKERRISDIVYVGY